MKLKKFVLVPSVLELYTNVTKISGFLFGTTLNYPIKRDAEKSAFRFRFIVLRKITDFSSINQSAKYRDITICEKTTKKILYEKKLFPFVKIQLLFEDGIIPVISCNSAYYRLFKFSIGGIPTPGETLSLIIGLYMTNRGFLPLRASAFSHKQASTILFGPKGSGKTTFLFDSITKYGCKVIGEDTIVLDDRGIVYCSVYLSSKLKYTRIALRALGVNVEHNNPSTLYELINDADKNIEEKAKVKHVIFLKHSLCVNTIKEIELDDAIQHVLLLNRATYSYEQIPVIQTLLYSNGSFQNFRKLEGEILRKALKDATCLVIESQSPQKAAKIFFDSSYFENV